MAVPTITATNNLVPADDGRLLENNIADAATVTLVNRGQFHFNHHRQYLSPLPPQESRLVSEEITPASSDVCCGRGKSHWNNPGNVKFRQLVAAHAADYGISVSRARKTIIVQQIIAAIQDNNGGRFLKKCRGQWIELEYVEMHDKVAHSLRDQFSHGGGGSNKSRAVVTTTTATIAAPPTTTLKYASSLHQTTRAKRRRSSLPPSVITVVLEQQPPCQRLRRKSRSESDLGKVVVPYEIDDSIEFCDETRQFLLAWANNSTLEEEDVSDSAFETDTSSITSTEDSATLSCNDGGSLDGILALL